MADTGKTIPLVQEHYTRSGITPARQMNRIGHEINMLTSSPDLIKTPTAYRYNQTATVAEPFQVIIDPTDKTKVSIRGGRWDLTTFGTLSPSMFINGGDFGTVGVLPSDIRDRKSVV